MIVCDLGDSREAYLADLVMDGVSSAIQAAHYFHISAGGQCGFQFEAARRWRVGMSEYGKQGTCYLQRGDTEAEMVTSRASASPSPLSQPDDS